MEKRVAGIGDALREINPEIKYTYLAEDYETLQILSDHEKPTKEAIESAKVKAQQKIDDSYYKIQRASAYPELKEQLDLLWHAIDDGKFNVKSKDTDFYKKLKAVKDANPKPE